MPKVYRGSRYHSWVNHVDVKSPDKRLAGEYLYSPVRKQHRTWYNTRRFEALNTVWPTVVFLTLKWLPWNLFLLPKAVFKIYHAWFLVGAFFFWGKMPDYSSDLFFLFSLQSSHWSVHFLQSCAEHLRPSPPKANFTPKGPPFHFLVFQGNIQNRTCPKGPPFGFFRHCATFFRKFFNVP